MNKKTITFVFCLASAPVLMAQNQPGGISSAMLKKIETSQKSSPAERALANAFASNNIDDLARNHAHKVHSTRISAMKRPNKASKTKRVRGVVGCFLA